jgi:hypothetical protein
MTLTMRPTGLKPPADQGRADYTADAAHHAFNRRSLPGLSGPLGLDDGSIPTK